MAVPPVTSGLLAYYDEARHYRSDGTTPCSGNPDSVYYWANDPSYGTKTFGSAVVYQHYDGNYVGAKNGLAVTYDTQGLAGYAYQGTPTNLFTSTAFTAFTVGMPAADDGYGTSFRAWYCAYNYPGIYPHYNIAAKSMNASIYDTTATTRTASLVHGSSQLGVWGIHTAMLDVSGTAKVYCGWSDTRTASMASASAPYAVHADPMGGYVYLNYVAGAYMNGYISQMIFYNRALSEAERMSVEVWLGQKWAINLPYVGGSFVVMT